MRVFGGNSFDTGKSIIQTSDNGYVLAGTTGSFFFESSQIVMMRLNEKGDHLWNQFYGGDLADFCESMAATLDGGYIITGFSETLDSTYNILVLRTDAEGELIWSRHYGGLQWDLGKKVIALADGGFAVVGQTNSRGAGQSDAILLRLDAQGDTLWTRTYGGLMPDGATSIATTDDDFIISGFTESFGNGDRDAWLVRIDDAGEVIWSKAYGGENEDFANAVVFTQDQGFAFAGGTDAGDFGGVDFNLVKTDGQGEVMWSYVSSSSGPTDDYWTDLFEEANGSLTMVGHGSNPNFGGGGLDAFMNRRTAQGHFDGVSGTYGELGNEKAYGVIRTSDNGYAIIGETTGYLSRQTDIALFKTGAVGQGVGFTVDVQEATVNSTSHRVVIAPNPFDSNTMLRMDGFNQWAPQLAAHVSVEIIDPIGKVVLTQLVNSASTPLHLSHLAQGMYVYRVIAGTQLIVSGRLVKTGN